MGFEAVHRHSAHAALHFLVLLPLTIGACLVAATAMPMSIKRQMQRIFKLRLDPVAAMLLYGLFLISVLTYGFR
jgi:hypothetical protein